MAGLLRSEAAPTGSTGLSDWLKDDVGSLGRRYVSELRRHFRLPLQGVAAIIPVRIGNAQQLDETPTLRGQRLVGDLPGIRDGFTVAAELKAHRLPSHI